MSYLPDPKDPAETITVAFDFPDTPSAPTVSIAVRWGTEQSPSLTTSGSAIVSGTQVKQKFAGGADLHDYDLKCLATLPSGDTVASAVTLAVRTRPIK